MVPIFPVSHMTSRWLFRRTESGFQEPEDSRGRPSITPAKKQLRFDWNNSRPDERLTSDEIPPFLSRVIFQKGVDICDLSRSNSISGVDSGGLTDFARA